MLCLTYRPNDGSSKPVGRGVLSMMGLSHGVIRVDTGEKLSILTLQDVGTPMPGGMQCVDKKSQWSQNDIINRKDCFW